MRDKCFHSLGIDSGFSMPGAAVLLHDHDILNLLATEALRTKPATKKERRSGQIYKSEDDARRVVEISDWLAKLLSDWDPLHIVIELPSAGAKSAGGIRGMALGAACAVATCTRMGYREHLHFVTPGQNKLGTTNDRFAEKDAVLAAVKRTFAGYDGWPTKLDRKKQRVADLEACFAAADAASAVLTWWRSAGVVSSI